MRSRMILAVFFAEFEVGHTTDINDIIIRDDIAIERASYTDTLTPKGGESVMERGKHIVIRQRGDDGQWRILWEIWNKSE